ncbi:hypothetical protein [Paraburkholderia susongensis]|uniref:hypothetical protein n=1 Tax=Paraburkholderia susongensis TaxID=1515439 RepID=UPI000A1C8E07|nr:hypothetical protein [Paraburkholderia susongensis]
MSRLIASAALLAAAASFTGCAVAPPAGYDYTYAQPYYPYVYGPPYAPVYGTVGIWGGFGGPCCYYHGGHGYWHGRGGWHGGGWHGGNGGWHGGGYGGMHGGGSAWSSGGGMGGGHSH